MLTKKKIIDKIEIFPELGTIQYRERTIIEEDGVEISSSLSRGQYENAEDKSGFPTWVEDLWNRPDFVDARVHKGVGNGPKS